MARRKRGAKSRAIKEFIYSCLAKGLSPKTVNNLKNIISGILTSAVEDELIAANPAARIGKLIKGQEDYVYVWTLGVEGLGDRTVLDAVNTGPVNRSSCGGTASAFFFGSLPAS